MSEAENTDIEQKRVVNLYGLFGASLVLSLFPYMTAVVLSTIFFIALLFMAYGMRRGVEVESLQENHATYIIRTLWIAAFFSLITMAAASVYMLSGIDYAPFVPCTDQIASMGLDQLEAAGVKDLYPIIEPCVESFVEQNHTLLVNCTVIAGVPILVYMAYRFTRGLMRAAKGYRLAKPKSWF
jgi:uncharacterized membrane protein